MKYVNYANEFFKKLSQIACIDIYKTNMDNRR